MKECTQWQGGKYQEPACALGRVTKEETIRVEQPIQFKPRHEKTEVIIYLERT